MKLEKGLLYSESHEWVEFTSDTTARVGLTDFAQEALGSIVFINLPEVGDDLIAGESFGDVESVKAVSEILSPVDGTIFAVNEALLDAPEAINEGPYDAWLIEVRDIVDRVELLSAEDYEAFCEKEEA